MEAIPQEERMVPLTQLGEILGSLRLQSPRAVRDLQHSLLHRGQVAALVAYQAADDRVEIVDGFKRLHAARELGWSVLRVRLLAVDTVQAKAMIGVLNHPCGLTELEEGWVVRSLYREDRITQPQIGRLLGRHKSWVCRRLMLVEGLVDVVQIDVRLGLLAARTACALSRLPRGNQQEVAEVVARRGLTTHQVDRFVTALLACPDESDRRRLLADEAGRWTRPVAAAAGTTGRPRSAVDLLMADIGMVTRLTGRLQARLLAQPLCVFGEQVAVTVRQSLMELIPVLAALQRTAQCTLTEEESHGTLEEPRGSRRPGRHPVPSENEQAGNSPGAGGEPQHGTQDPHGPCPGTGGATPSPRTTPGGHTPGEEAGPLPGAHCRDVPVLP